VQQQLRANYMEQVRLQLSVDSLRVRRKQSIKKTNDKKDSVAVLNGDGLDSIIRASLRD